MSEEKTEGPSFVAVVGLAVLLLAGALAIGELPRLYRQHYAATPEDLARVALDTTPKGLAGTLHAAKEQRTEVKVELRPGITSFENATFRWDESPDHVSRISLHAVREEDEPHGKKEGTNAPRNLAGKLDDVLPGVSKEGHREWGPVRFDASSDGDLSFDVKSSLNDHQPNPLFARQVEAARQILVEVAFDVPHTVSKQELADTLGTGYPIKELASIDPRAPQADSVRALTSKLAAAIEDSEGVLVPIEHVVVSAAHLRWSPFRSHFELSFRPRRSFKDHRAAFITCLEGHTGTPALHDGPIAVVRFAPGDPLVVQGIQINVTADTVETFTYDAGASIPTYSALIAAMDACNK